LGEFFQSNQVPIRLKATILLGRMFSVPGRQVPPEYQQLFSEFLKRLNDEDVDVRVAAVNCAKVYLETTKSSTVETSEILVALGEQLCCFNDGVRITAMNAICNFARVNLNLSPPGILHKVADCLQDTKVGGPSCLRISKISWFYQLPMNLILVLLLLFQWMLSLKKTMNPLGFLLLLLLLLLFECFFCLPIQGTHHAPGICGDESEHDAGFNQNRNST
jgi:hypothetical protein